MEHPKVVITGMGVVSSIGNGIEAFAQGLREGKSGVGAITRYDTSFIYVKIIYLMQILI